MLIEHVPYRLRDLALCGCLMDVAWLEAGRGGSFTGNHVAMWTGPVNAAKNCPFCEGSGFDQDRFAGALIRILGRWLKSVELFSDGEWRVRYLDGRNREWIIVANTLLAALLQVYEVVRVSDGEYHALGTNGQFDWFRADPDTKYQLPPRGAAGRRA